MPAYQRPHTSLRLGAVGRFRQPHQVDAELEGLRLARDNRNREHSREPHSSFGTTSQSGISQAQREARIARMVAARQKKPGLES